MLPPYLLPLPTYPPIPHTPPSMDQPAMTTRRRASHRRLLFVTATDKVDMLSLVDLGLLALLGLLPLRLCGLLGGRPG